MNKKVITIIIVIIIVIGIGIGAFFIGSNVKNNTGAENSKIEYEASAEKDTFNKIVGIIDELRNEEEIDVTINADMMEDLTELYSENPSNFNKDTVYEYLISAGWIARGTTNGGTSNKKATSQSTEISDTKIRELLQEDWKRYNGRMYKVSISKIEKAEEDGKGRYIYVIYWSYYDQDTEISGWSPYTLYDVDISGEMKQVTVYGVDTTNTPDNPKLISTETSGTQAYELIQKMKQKEELNWNK